MHLDLDPRIQRDLVKGLDPIEESVPVQVQEHRRGTRSGAAELAEARDAPPVRAKGRTGPVRQDRDHVENPVPVHVRDERGPEPGRVHGRQSVLRRERVAASLGAAVMDPGDKAVASHVKHLRVSVMF